VRRRPAPGGPPRRHRARTAALLLLGLAGVAGAAALLRPPPPPPPGPEPGRGLYRAHCATCHGSDGRGRTWRARLLWLRPGNLAAPAAAALSDAYLADLIRHGGATYGKPGMPSFGFTLSDAEIRALVAYLRTLPRGAGAPPGR
jgi:mono/diheme cytochrome c family protein